MIIAILVTFIDLAVLCFNLLIFVRVIMSWLPRAREEDFVLTAPNGGNMTADKVELFARLAHENHRHAHDLALRERRAGGPSASILSYALSFESNHKL